jgi:polyisoprenoid-binding protein YceI
MKKYLILSVLFLFVIFQSKGQAKYVVNADTSEIVWIGKKVSGEHRGKVKILNGEFETNKNNQITSGKFDVDMRTIMDEDPIDVSMKTLLENHLKSTDFFDVINFPLAHFEITSPVTIEKGNSKIKGNLTIKNMSQPILIKALFMPTSYGYLIFSSFSIDRSSYNVKYGSATFYSDIAEKIIYDDFQILLRLQVKKQMP